MVKKGGGNGEGGGGGVGEGRLGTVFLMNTKDERKNLDKRQTDRDGETEKKKINRLKMDWEEER